MTDRSSGASRRRIEPGASKPWKPKYRFDRKEKTLDVKSVQEDRRRLDQFS
jgi:hypothetical protein